MKKLALIIPFKRSAPPRSRDWSAQELAEFYRVQTSLARIGMTVSVDRGLSDEGEPWFVFCREPDGEPIIHFARIDSCYVMAGSVLGELLRGLDLRTLVAKALEREEMRRAALRGANADGTVSWHPAALVSVLVGIVYFFSTGPTEASTPRDHQAKDEARGDGGSRGGAAEKTFAAPQSDIAAQASVLSAQIGHLAAAILVAVSLETPTAPRAWPSTTTSRSPRRTPGSSAPATRCTPTLWRASTIRPRPPSSRPTSRRRRLMTKRSPSIRQASRSRAWTRARFTPRSRPPPGLAGGRA
jgi:hypothetical protein